MQMGIDNLKIGTFIQELRKRKSLTQIQLAERLNISYQAVSKWERGETLPDTSLLLDLAAILETSVDNILNGGETIMDYTKKISVKEIKLGIDQLSNIGSLIGKDNSVYMGLVEGINNKMNIDIEECFTDSFKREALISEIIVQDIKNGVYVDISEIKSTLQHEHWIKTVLAFAEKYGLK